MIVCGALVVAPTSSVHTPQELAGKPADRIAAVEAGLPPGIALAGAALRGVGVPACIRSGREAATRVLAQAGADR